MQALFKSWSKHLDHPRREENPEEEKLVGESSEPFGQFTRAKAYRITRPMMKSIITFLLKGFILALATYGTVNLASCIRTKITRARQDNHCECGRSVAEAIANGCKYDELAAAWLPPHCRDEELTAEFSKAGPDGQWGYWLDQNATNPVSPNELGLIADTDEVYWATTEWHIVHCIFYSIKQYRSKTTGIVVEERYDNEGHIRHCGMVMLKYMVSPRVNTFQSAVLTSKLIHQQA